MRPVLSRLTLFALITFATACAARQPAAPGASTDRDLITRQQILEHRFNNAYEAVESLHSNWLQTKGTDSFRSPSQVWVYLDDTKLGGIETLREIASATIGSIRHYDGI